MSACARCGGSCAASKAPPSSRAAALAVRLLDDDTSSVGGHRVMLPAASWPVSLSTATDSMCASAPGC